MRLPAPMLLETMPGIEGHANIISAERYRMKNIYKHSALSKICTTSPALRGVNLEACGAPRASWGSTIELHPLRRHKDIIDN